jgi:hypothetical protein
MVYKGFRVQGSGTRVQVSGFRVQVSGFQDFGFRVLGLVLRFRVQVWEFRGVVSGFRVPGFMLRGGDLDHDFALGPPRIQQVVGPLDPRFCERKGALLVDDYLVFRVSGLGFRVRD